MSQSVPGNRRFIDRLPYEDVLRGSPLATAGLSIVLILSLALALQLLHFAALAQQTPVAFDFSHKVIGPAFVRALPYPVVDYSFGPPRWVLFALIGVGAVQSLALFALYRILRRRVVTNLERVLLALAGVTMTAVALHATALSSFDPYAYTGYAKLANLSQAYAPPPARFSGTFAAVNDVWGSPLVPCYYGPLWFAISKLVAGGAPSLGSAIFAFRLLEAGALGAVVALCAAWRRDAVPVALIALNPALYSLYVANAHNDLLAVALILCAAVLARRFPLAASAGVAAAALIKIPFVAAALYVFAGRGDLVRRTFWVALTAVLAIGLSLAFGGRPYVDDLLARLHQTTQSSGALYLATARAIKIGLVLVALLALFSAFLRNVIWRTGGWSFITLGSQVYPWYLIWALPYAALERRALTWFLVPLPLAAAFMEPAFPHVGLGQAAMLVMLLAAAYEMLRARPLPVEE